MKLLLQPTGFLIGLILMLSVDPASAQNTSDQIPDSLQSRITEFTTLLTDIAFKNNASTLGLGDFYDQDARLVPSDSIRCTIRGAKGITDYWGRQRETNYGIHFYPSTEVEVKDSSIAHQTGRFYLVNRSDLSDYPVDAGEYFIVWEREGDTWSVKNHSWISVPPRESLVKTPTLRIKRTLNYDPELFAADTGYTVLASYLLGSYRSTGSIASSQECGYLCAYASVNLIEGESWLRSKNKERLEMRTIAVPVPDKRELEVHASLAGWYMHDRVMPSWEESLKAFGERYLDQLENSLAPLQSESVINLDTTLSYNPSRFETEDIFSELKNVFQRWVDYYIGENGIASATECGRYLCMALSANRLKGEVLGEGTDYQERLEVLAFMFPDPEKRELTVRFFMDGWYRESESHKEKSLETYANNKLAAYAQQRLNELAGDLGANLN